MKLDIASLAIGLGIGVAIVSAVAVVFVLQPGRIVLDNEKAMAAIVSGNRSHFFMSGLITDMTDNVMIIDQTFGNPEYTDNPAVRIRLDRGAAFVSCVGTGVPEENCQDSIIRRLGQEPVFVCAHTRIYNGEFYAGKIWADSGCGPFSQGATGD